MGYLAQSSSPIADFNKITVSMWLRISSDISAYIGSGHYVSLLQFGESNPNLSGTGPATTLSTLALQYISGSPPYINLNLFMFGRHNTSSFNAQYDEFIAANGGFPTTGTAHYTPYIENSSGGWTAVSNNFAIGQWAHLFITADVSRSTHCLQPVSESYSGFGPPVTPMDTGVLCRTFLNLTDESSDLSDPSFGNAQSSPNHSCLFKSFDVGRDMSLRMLSASGWDSITGVGVAAPPYFVGGGTTSTDDSAYGQASIPGWSAAINGLDVGFPNLGLGAGAQPTGFSLADAAIDFSDVQIWFGRYIDPTPTNLSKFAVINGGRGRPVNPSAAAAAFGTPTVFFKGNHSSFVVNNGSGGSFSKVGTVFDFTPGPSF